MSLLMPTRPIVINPDLAYSIGLNEAIVLQQVNYWLKETTSGLEREGVRWIYNTTEQWLEQFPFWSESTLKRTFTRLKSLGVLQIKQLNKSQRDMTNYYTINYASDLLDDVKVNESKKSKCTLPSGQNDTMGKVKVNRSNGSKRTAVIGSNCTDDPTENTTESTTDNKTLSCPGASLPDSDVNSDDSFTDAHPDAAVLSARKRYWGTHEDLTCAEWIHKRIRKLYEAAAETDGEVALPKAPNWTAWANDVRLMRMQDGRSHSQICAMFDKVSRDPFWCRNILSPSKLREKWDDLAIRLSPAAGRIAAEDQLFKSSYQSTDYSQVPEGFRS